MPCLEMKHPRQFFLVARAMFLMHRGKPTVSSLGITRLSSKLSIAVAIQHVEKNRRCLLFGAWCLELADEMSSLLELVYHGNTLLCTACMKSLQN